MRIIVSPASLWGLRVDGSGGFLKALQLPVLCSSEDVTHSRSVPCGSTDGICDIGRDEGPPAFPWTQIHWSCQEVTQTARVSPGPPSWYNPGSVSDGARQGTGPRACRGFPVGGVGMGGTGCRVLQVKRLSGC